MLAAPTASIDQLIDWVRGQGGTATRMSSALPAGVNVQWMLLRGPRAAILLDSGQPLSVAYVRTILLQLGLSPDDFWRSAPLQANTGGYPPVDWES